MQRLFYTFCFYLSLPAVFFRLWWRSRQNPDYSKRWLERLGFFMNPSIQNSIWIHAVSVGETLAAIPLIKAIKENHPNVPLVVTGMTPTGSERVKTLLDGKVFHVYAPYDLPDAISRFLKRLKPKLLILMETELWPNWLHACKKNHIPVFVANARLSAKSAQGYERFQSFVKEMLQGITQLAAQTSDDAKRFVKLGLNPEHIQVTGSIKFDLSIPGDLAEKGRKMRTTWGSDRPVFIAASTHEGEDEYILEAFTQIRQSIPNVMLLLVLRHPERRAKVLTLCKNYKTYLRSEGVANLTDADILIGDTIGELMLFYAASDVAFVGGSFVPTGGHNMLEPAALNLPVITGPHLFNFTEISRMLLNANAAYCVKDATQLAEKVVELLKNKSLREEIGSNGKKVVEQNRGALARHLSMIDALL